MGQRRSGPGSRRLSFFQRWTVPVLGAPLIVLVVVLLLLLWPFYFLHGLMLRCLIELLWARRGKRILLVYSLSPHWQEYIESRWIPRVAPYAVILNWSDRAQHSTGTQFAWRVFRRWAPHRDFNPMAIMFPRWRRTRCIGFYYAFRDLRHGKTEPLESAEGRLFDFVRELEGSA